MDLTLLRSKVPRCQHLKTDGVQCNLPAVGRRPFCHRHTAMHRATVRTADARNAPLIHVEDLASLQLALNDVIQRLLRGQIDHRDASVIIRSLRTMLSAMRMEQDSPTYGPDVVRNPSQLSPHVDWERHMTDEDKQLREQHKQGVGRSINSILTKITRHLANDTGIACDELGPEEDDEPCYGADGKLIIVGPPRTPSDSAPGDPAPCESHPESGECVSGESEGDRFPHSQDRIECGTRDPFNARGSEDLLPDGAIVRLTPDSRVL